LVEITQKETSDINNVIEADVEKWGNSTNSNFQKTQIWLEYEYGVIFLVLMRVVPMMIN
jgi:hypothetical protein